MHDLTRYKEIFGEFATDVDFISEVIDNLYLDMDDFILDVGTGMGAMSILLALKGFRVLTGEPELDPESEEEAHHGHHHKECDDESWNDWRTSAKTLGVENLIKYTNFDVQSLSVNLVNQLFDAIFLYDTMQHVKDRKNALNECVRVLKEDGVIVIIEWTKNQIEKDFKKYGFKIEYIDPRVFVDLEQVSIEELTSKAVNAYLLRKR